MANEKKIDCIILGLLSHEELTGYEIKKRIDTTLKYFWSASYGSIYPALNGLVARGLATKRKDTVSRRNKLFYTITEDGREYLKKWLALPVEKDMLHYETLLKLFFGNEQGAEQTILHIEAFEEKIKKELPYLISAKKMLKDCLEENSAHKYYLLTVEFGIKTYMCYLEWCKEARKFLTNKGE